MDQLNRIVHFDWHRDRVLRDDITVCLSGQEKILLQLIVDNGGRTCGRVELMVAIWGARAPHVDELYLTQLIYRLRRSLRPVGLTAHIVTVPRTGYRFESEGLECRFGDSATAAPQTASHEPASGDHRRREAFFRDLFSWFACAREGAVDTTGATGPASSLPTIEPLHHGITYAGVTVHLTRLEHALLDVLITHPGGAIGRAELIARIWGNGAAVDANRLTRLVSRLRRSLQPLGLDRHVVYMPCEGYRFRCERIPTAAQTGERARLRLRELRRNAMRGAAHAVVLLAAALSVCGTALPTSVGGDAVSAPADANEAPGRRTPQSMSVRSFAFDTTLRRLASVSAAVEAAARRRPSSRPAR
jgi:DNA-binding winged helix-turn-helix (wHTH) protein